MYLRNSVQRALSIEYKYSQFLKCQSKINKINQLQQRILSEALALDGMLKVCILKMSAVIPQCTGKVHTTSANALTI